MDIKVGKKYKGKINNEIFEITDFDEAKDTIYYKNKGKDFYYGLRAFKNCLLEEVNE